MFRNDLIALPPVMKSKKPLWRRLVRGTLVSLTALMASLGVFEVIVRMTTDTIPPLTVRDALLGRRYVQAFEKRVYVPEAEREILLRFNELGFRGDDRPYEKPEGVKRVALLGDSMIAALTVEENETAAKLLEAMLNEGDQETTWEVMNFGVSGSSTGQELVLYREIVSKFDPDVVLCCYFVGNDLADNCRRMTSSPRIYFELDENGELEQQPLAAGRAALSEALNRHSRLYLWCKETERKLKRMVRKDKRMQSSNWIYCTQESEDVAYAWKLSEALIHELADEVREDDVEFGLVVIPCAPQIYDDYFAEISEPAGELAASFDQDYPTRKLSGFCSSWKIPMLVMTESFRAAAPSHSRAVESEWLFHDGKVHFNVKGNQLAANEMHSFMATNFVH